MGGWGPWEDRGSIHQRSGSERCDWCSITSIVDPIVGAVVIAGLKYVGQPSAEVLKDLVQRVLGPSADAKGQAIKEWLENRNNRAQQTVVEAATLMHDAAVEPQAVPGRLLLPILEWSSVQDEPELRLKWAALLANAATPDSNKTSGRVDRGLGRGEPVGLGRRSSGSSKSPETRRGPSSGRSTVSSGPAGWPGVRSDQSYTGQPGAQSCRLVCLRVSPGRTVHRDTSSPVLGKRRRVSIESARWSIGWDRCNQQHVWPRLEHLSRADLFEERIDPER